MPAKAIATPNIALIKYWGNRNDTARLPAADSVSMTLNSPSVEIEVDHAEQLSVKSFNAEGVEKILKEKDIARFAKHLELTKRYLAELGAPDAFPASASLIIRSHIPSAIGLASSAAVFGCLAKAYAGLITQTLQLDDRRISVIARLGSGSAARSIFEGYASLLAGTGEALDSSYAELVAPASHWKLHDIVIVPSQDEKKVGSTEGHASAWSSSLYAERLAAMPRRNKECIEAIRAKDFEKLRRAAEEDSLDMHAVMRSQNPPLEYLSEETWRIIREVTELRDHEKLDVLYTMDAGPTVHLLCTGAALPTVAAFARAQKNCTIFETSVGSGARLV
jgi:diphosphomevalonate decarboxylase